MKADENAFNLVEGITLADIKKFIDNIILHS